MPRFTLDFNIYSSKDRMEAIKKIPLNQLNNSELETITNYILYGKDEDGTSIVDRKEVQIKTKFKSYNKERFVSLDEMMESPTFDESILSKDQTIYKKVKPTIDKEKAKLIPGMEELWGNIDNLSQILDENTGKSPKTSKTPTLNQKQIYYLKHQLIELRTQQYYLMDSYFPTFLSQKNKSEYYTNPVDTQMNYPILPRGLMREENDPDFRFPQNDRVAATKIWTDDEVKNLQKSGKPFIDFRNHEHVYQLIQHYEEIRDQGSKTPDSPLNNLLWTLDFYIEKAELSEQQKLIIQDKKNNLLNKEIVQHLQDELGIYHQENYISTIWNKSIDLIIAAVELNYDEYLCKDYQKAWKQCSRCGRTLLRDPRNFVKKAKAIDGLTGRCKCCDKEIRQMRR